MNNPDQYTKALRDVLPIVNIGGKLVTVHLGYYQWKEHKGRTIEKLERKIYEAVNKKEVLWLSPQPLPQYVRLNKFQFLFCKSFSTSFKVTPNMLIRWCARR